MNKAIRNRAVLLLGGIAAAAMAPSPAAAQPVPAAASPTYADLADLADSAQFAVKATVRKLAAVPAARLRSPVASGRVRYHVTAKTVALLTGARPLGAEIAYLADLPVDARGRPLVRKKASVLLFAREAPGGQLQLVAPDAQIAWSAPAETRLREILYELVAPEAPPRITGVREAIHVPGTLRGEGETQIFLATEGDAAASLSVRSRPGGEPVWGVSFSELAAETGNAPARDTLAWYRLACFLPADLPAAANRSASATERAQAVANYRFVLARLGDCPRTRG